MSNIDKQALRRHAIAATKGSWVFSRSGANSNVQAPIELQKGGRALVVLCKLNNAGWSGQIQTENNAKFIAAANPETVLALLDELEAIQSFRTVFKEWHDKTEWVQGDKRFDVIKPWGKHRADVLKFYIDHLESKLEAAEQRNAELVHNHRVHAARLIDERGQLKQRIAELREWNAGLAQESCIQQQRIADLEARAVTLEPFRSFVTDADIAALHRFAECCDDPESGGHDLEKEQVRRLEAIGALQRSGRISYITDFGDVLISITAGISKGA